MIKVFRDMFLLPEPVELIRIIDAEVSMGDDYVLNWHKSYKREKTGQGNTLLYGRKVMNPTTER